MTLPLDRRRDRVSFGDSVGSAVIALEIRKIADWSVPAHDDEACAGALRGLERDFVTRAAVSGERASHAELDFLITGVLGIDRVHHGLDRLGGSPAPRQQSRPVRIGRTVLMADGQVRRRRYVVPIESRRLPVDPVRAFCIDSSCPGVSLKSLESWGRSPIILTCGPGSRASTMRQGSLTRKKRAAL